MKYKNIKVEIKIQKNKKSETKSKKLWDTIRGRIPVEYPETALLLRVSLNSVAKMN